MRRFSKIFIFTIAIIILTLSLALAGAKFQNEDTAKNRQDNALGTEPGDNTSSNEFGNNDAGDNTIKSKARSKRDPVDWYEKIIISVNPSTSWPKGDGTTTQTTTSFDSSNSTGVGNYTDTETIENKNW